MIPAACVTLLRRGQTNLEVLLVKRLLPPRAGLWALPGGKFEKDVDQTLMDTAVREMFEETGVRVQAEPNFYTKHTTGNGRFLLHHFLATNVLNDVRDVKAMTDASAVKWQDVDSIIDSTWNEQFVEDLPIVLSRVKAHIGKDAIQIPSSPT